MTQLIGPFENGPFENGAAHDDAAVRRSRAWVPLIGGSLLLSAVSLTVVLLAPVLEPAFREGRLYLDVLMEDNLPTWWSTALLATAAVVHALVGVAGHAAGAPGGYCWYVSAAVLTALSLDDQTQLHERSEHLGRHFGTYDAYPFHWLIPGAVAGLAVVGALTLLAVRVQGRTRWLLVSGVTVLLGCALGLELVQGFFMAGGNEHLGFTLTYHVEELGENAGALLLLAAASNAVSITREDGGIAVRYRSVSGVASPK